MQQQRTCPITGKTFIVRDEDMVFYEKISPVFAGHKYLIPPPTLSPGERTRRRLSYRNENKLFKRKSSLSGRTIISFFRPDSPYQIYTQDEWWSDKWDPMYYGRDFDFGRSFFEQFHKMQLMVPRPPLVNNQAENSDYCNFADRNKNCYLITSSNDNSDCYYGFLLVKNRDCVDSSFCTDSELLFQCIDCLHCYNLNYCQNCENCIESEFLLNCRGVRNCFMCANLFNKEQYCFFNKAYSKDEFQRRVAETKSNNENFARALAEFENLKCKFPVKDLQIVSSENAIGDYIFNSKNIFCGFVIYNSDNCAYLHEGVKGSNCHDICFFDGVQWCYESTSLIGYGYKFTNFCRNSADLFYCDNCHGCKNCFGCIGLRNREFCIFNKQYKKEQYEELAGRIVLHMSRFGDWGEFFPMKYSLFPYDDTLAREF